MGRLDEQRVYVDANAVIYFGDGHQVLGPPVRSLIGLATDGGLTLVTSELTLCEVLVLPYKLKQADMVEFYGEIPTNRTMLEVVPISRVVLVEAARARAASVGNCRTQFTPPRRNGRNAR